MEVATPKPIPPKSSPPEPPPPRPVVVPESKVSPGNPPPPASPSGFSLDPKPASTPSAFSLEPTHQTNPSIDFVLTSENEIPTRIAPKEDSSPSVPALAPILPPASVRIPSVTELPFERIEDGDSVVMIGKKDEPSAFSGFGPVPEGDTAVVSRPSSKQPTPPPSVPISDDDPPMASPVSEGSLEIPKRLLEQAAKPAISLEPTPLSPRPTPEPPLLYQTVMEEAVIPEPIREPQPRLHPTPGKPNFPVPEVEKFEWSPTLEPPVSPASPRRNSPSPKPAVEKPILPKPAVEKPISPPHHQPVPGADRPTVSLGKPQFPRQRESVPVAERSPRGTPTPPGVKEVAWSAESAPPPPLPPFPGQNPTSWSDPGRQEPPVDTEPVENVEPVQQLIRRRRKSPWRGVFLTGLILATVVALVGIGYGFLRHSATQERRESEEAQEAYEKGNFAVAATRFDKLAKEFPGTADGDRYQFFAELASTRATIDAVTTRENPGLAAKKLGDFLTKFGNSPHAQAGTGYGADIVLTGQKLADIVADHAGDRLKSYRVVSTDPEKYQPADVSTAELDAGEAAIAEARAMLPALDRFREKDGPSFSGQRQRFDDLSADFAKERKRLDFLAPYRTLPVDPTDDSIETSETALRVAGYLEDPQVREILRTAKRKLQELIKYTPGVVDARRAPGEMVSPVLFASPVLGSTEPRTPTDAPPDVVFAVARGVLYALDTHTGSLLWGTRVAAITSDLRTADVPVRVSAGDGSEWVLVASDLGGKPGLTARVARTGEVVWHQPLEAGFAGRPTIVGRRAYVPLADPMGTIVELQLATGRRLGQIQIRQPIGMPPVASTGARAGTGFLYIPADARRVFVFEVGREADDGDREPPRCVRVIGTGHPRDSLRGEPVLVGNSEAPGAKYLILQQSDGPAAMKLRCYTLPPTSDLVANRGGIGAPETIPEDRPAEVPIPGWSWFPPVTDGERVVVATDSGDFTVFGVNQLGNLDRPLFALPGPKSPEEHGETVNRAVVVSADEDSVWAILGGELQRLRVAIDPVAGMRYVRHGTPRKVGEPTHRAQVRPSANVGVVVVRSGPTSAARAIAFDLESGALRWDVHLGAVPASSPVTFPGNLSTLIDTEGGVYTIPLDGPATASASVVAKPVAEPAGRSQVVRSENGATAWVLIPEMQKGMRKLRVRQIEKGVVAQETAIPLADSFAGTPVLTGHGIVIPLADGYLHRLAKSGELQRGPAWRAASANRDAVCFLTPFQQADVIATDGGIRATRWRWPAESSPIKVAGPWETRTRIALPPAMLRDQGRPRIALAEAAGGITLYDADRTDEPIMRWRHTTDNTIPAGPAGIQLSTIPLGQKDLLIYAVGGRRLVALETDKANPVWLTWVASDDGPEILGWQVRGQAIYTTDQSGKVTVIAAQKGVTLSNATVPGEGIFVTVPAEILGNRAILGLADGTVQVVPVKPGN